MPNDMDKIEYAALQLAAGICAGVFQSTKVGSPETRQVAAKNAIAVYSSVLAELREAAKITDKTSPFFLGFA